MPDGHSAARTYSILLDGDGGDQRPDDPIEPCLDSPFCRRASCWLSRARVGPDNPAVWQHYGPISTSATPLARHATGGGGGDWPGYAHARVPTRPAHAAFAGLHVDVLGVLRRPDYDCSIDTIEIGRYTHPLYVIARQVWREAGGAIARIAPSKTHEPTASWTFTTQSVTEYQLREMARFQDLLLGRVQHLGRPPRRVVVDDWLDIAKRAERLRAATPGRTWLSIAAALNVDERTLRTYRGELSRLQASLEHEQNGGVAWPGARVERLY
jgi:hypothetical protein